MNAGMIVAQLAMMALTSIIGYLSGKLKEKKSKQDARIEHDRLMEEGMKAVLRRDIMDAYEKYVVNGDPLTIERKQELDDEFAVYDGLDGNGTGKQAYNEVCKIKMQVMQKEE